MQDTSRAYFITEALGDAQTRVKWGMAGQSKFPINIICLLMNMKGTLAKDFDEGLSNLKALLEKAQ